VGEGRETDASSGSGATTAPSAVRAASFRASAFCFFFLCSAALLASAEFLIAANCSSSVGVGGGAGVTLSFAGAAAVSVVESEQDAPSKAQANRIVRAVIFMGKVGNED
jgi:hypothetical protein